MKHVLLITIKGIFRDRIFQGIICVAALFFLIPNVSSLSMRQGTELSITLSLSLLSFILLLLAVFLGGTTIWKDVERRYTFGVLGLPLSRRSYLLGRFAGNALFLCLTALLLGLLSVVVVKMAMLAYPPFRPVRWDSVLIAIVFDTLKSVLIVAIAFMFSSLSTSFFLPVFGTISMYLVGSATQEVYDYLHSSSESIKGLSPVVVNFANALYYILPNLSAFDYKLHAVYGLDIPFRGLALTFLYFFVYTGIVLTLASFIFGRREMK